MIFIHNFIEIYNNHIKVREATKKGYAIATWGDSINLEQPNSKTRRGRVGRQIAQTLTTSCNQGVVVKGDDNILNCLNQLGYIDKNKQGNRVYDDNCSKTIESIGGGLSGKTGFHLTNKQINRSDDMWKNNLEQFKFNMEDIKIFDSFSGIGALHKSLTKLGVPVILKCMSEIDPDSIIDYAAIHLTESEQNKEFNYPLKEDMQKWLMDKNIGWDLKKQKSSIPRMKLDKLKKLYKASILCNNYGDISLIAPSNLPDFDMFNFSFPCTDISVSGKQEGMKDKEGNITRSGLYVYGINIIKIKKPKYIMIENVKNLISKKFIGEFNNIVNQIEEIGYKCYYYTKENGQPKCLNAKDYGIPQNRERIFVICVRNDVKISNFKFPEGFDNGIRLKHLLEDTVDEKYYIAQEKTEKLITQIKDKNTLMLDMCQAKREGCPREYTDYSPTLSARDYKEPRLINELNMIGMLDIKGNEQIRRVYDEKGVSPTLSTMQGGNRQPKVLKFSLTTDEILFMILNFMFDIFELEEGLYDEQKGRTNKVLQTLWKKIREKEIQQQIGRSNCIQKEEILQSRMYETRLHKDRKKQFYLEQFPYNSENNKSEHIKNMQLRSLWKRWQTRRASQRYGLSEQQYKQFNDIMSFLPYENSQEKENLYNMWKTSEGLGILQQALFEIQEIWESINDKKQNELKELWKEQYRYDAMIGLIKTEAYSFKIRKLSPLECFRLMGFDDEDFYKAKAQGTSDSQLYKQAGNSIVVNVLYYIFKELFKEYIIEEN